MIVGLVLAGGEGQRLGGVRKTDLLVAGITLSERVKMAMAERCDLVLMATGPQGVHSEFELPDDPADPAGPVASLYALSRWLEGTEFDVEAVLTAAVDAPGLPNNFADQLLETLQGAGAAFAACGNFEHPTHAAWCPSSLAHVLHQRPTSPRAALGLARAQRVSFGTENKADPFRSINTLADLLFWQARFAQPRTRRI